MIDDKDFLLLSLGGEVLIVTLRFDGGLIDVNIFDAAMFR